MHVADQYLIVEGCKANRGAAQSQLYSLYAQAMYNVCLRMVGNAPDAEDVLQHAFMDIFSKINSFRQESTIGAWIKRIVINNCINFLKSRRLHFEELSDKAYHAFEEEIDHNDPIFSIEIIQRALQQLPEGYRVVFTLYLIEGYDHEEIASILRISEATSKSQFSRAKAKMREILKYR
jgi:RNA polymerase sigma-70 factor (ECF subfamily)